MVHQPHSDMSLSITSEAQNISLNRILAEQCLSSQWYKNWWSTAWEGRKTNNMKWNIALSFNHRKYTWQLNFGEQGLFWLLTHTILSADRLIIIWLSTYSSQKKVHKYLAVMVDINKVWQADLNHIMFMFIFSLQTLFTLLICGSNYHSCFLFLGWIHCKTVHCFQTLPVLIRYKYLLGLGAGTDTE